MTEKSLEAVKEALQGKIVNKAVDKGDSLPKQDLSAVEETKTEVKAEVKPEITPEKFRELAKLEYELQQARQEAKRAAQDREELLKFKQTFEKDPVQFAYEHKIPIDKFAKRVLDDGKLDSDSRLEELNKNLLELSEWKKQQEERATQTARQQYIGGFINEIKPKLENEEYIPIKHWVDMQTALLGGNYDLSVDVDQFITGMESQGRRVGSEDVIQAFLEPAKNRLQALKDLPEATKKYLIGLLSSTEEISSTVSSIAPSKRAINNDLETSGGQKLDKDLTYNQKLNLMAKKLKELSNK